MRFCALLFAGAAAVAQQPEVRCTVVEAGSGEPLAGVHVRLTSPQKDAYGAISERDGQFSIAPVPPGTYLVTLDKAGYLGRRSRGGIPTQSLTVKAGQARGDCRFEMTRRAGISGRVVDANGDPAPGVPIVLLTPSGEIAEWPGVPREVKTDSRGMYRVSPAGGSYRIRAEGWNAPGSGPTYSRGVIDAPPGAEIAGVDIQLAPWRPATVSGTVSGIPAGDSALVLSVSTVDGREQWGMGDVKSDGAFSVAWEGPGAVRFFVQTKSGARSAVTVVEPRDGDVAVGLVVAQPVEVTGTVEMPPGRAARQVRLELTGQLAYMSRAFSGMQYVYDGNVAADGTFRMERVPLGKYRLRILPEADDSYVKAPAGILDLAAPARLKVVGAIGAAWLSGTVEGDSGSASVNLLPEGAEREDALLSARVVDGAFRFTGLAPGRYRLFVADLPPEWIELHEGDHAVRTLKAPDAK
jgi:hypothetical protein